MMLDLAIGLLVGFCCGAVFFGGLRWTVSRLETARRPALLLIASLLVRLAAVTGAIVLAADARLVRVLAALAGLLIVRTAMVAVARREVAALEVAAPWT